MMAGNKTQQRALRGALGPGGEKTGGRFVSSLRADDLSLLSPLKPLPSKSPQQGCRSSELNDKNVTGPWRFYDDPTSCKTFLVVGLDSLIRETIESRYRLGGVVNTLGTVLHYSRMGGRDVYKSSTERHECSIHTLSMDGLGDYRSVLTLCFNGWDDISEHSDFAKIVTLLPPDYVVIGEECQQNTSAWLENIQDEEMRYQEAERYGTQNLQQAKILSHGHLDAMLAQAERANSGMGMLENWSLPRQKALQRRWMNNLYDAYFNNHHEATTNTKVHDVVAAAKKWQPPISGASGCGPIHSLTFCLHGSFSCDSNSAIEGFICDHGGQVLENTQDNRKHADIVILGAEEENNRWICSNEINEQGWLHMAATERSRHAGLVFPEYEHKPK